MAWNPVDLGNFPLQPLHYKCQFSQHAIPLEYSKRLGKTRPKRRCARKRLCCSNVVQRFSTPNNWVLFHTLYKYPVPTHHPDGCSKLPPRRDHVDEAGNGTNHQLGICKRYAARQRNRSCPTVQVAKEKMCVPI